MAAKTSMVTLRLSRRDLKRVEAVQALEKVDRATLLREFIEDGLKRRVLGAYQNGKITSQRAAEILDMSLREFLETLERAGIPVNWDTAPIREYWKARYGE